MGQQNLAMSKGSFGALLRQYRLFAGLTQEALANRAALAVRGIQDLERNRHQPHRQTVQRLISALALEGEQRARFEAESSPRPRRARPPAQVRLLDVGQAACPPRHNLPEPLTSFVGREPECATLGGLLRTTRFLTLIGAGRVGKTRLAVEAARHVLGRYPDGVWLVDLAPLADLSLVSLTVATVLDVRERPGELTVATLVTFLRNKHLLLILDNCEHLIEACGRVVREVLEACPGVSILATSRSRLYLTGETVFRVRSLTIPSSDQLSSVEGLLRVDAARLFVDRATAARSDLVVAPEDAEREAHICRRLEGIPLALELAAARLSALTIEQVASRLDDQFRLLTVGDLTALPRRQTLRTAVDWSYDLLGDAEKWLWRRLAVFAGGFALEASDEVSDVGCQVSGPRSALALREAKGQDRTPADDVLDLLTRLVDKSLVVMEERGGEARYRLLEPLRQYAREKLAEAGEDLEARDKHRDWCLSLGKRAEPMLQGPRRTTWLDRLDLEIDNLRASLEWCRDGSGGVDYGLGSGRRADTRIRPDLSGRLVRHRASPPKTGDRRAPGRAPLHLRRGPPARADIAIGNWRGLVATSSGLYILYSLFLLVSSMRLEIDLRLLDRSGARVAARREVHDRDVGGRVAGAVHDLNVPFASRSPRMDDSVPISVLPLVVVATGNIDVAPVVPGLHRPAVDARPVWTDLACHRKVACSEYLSRTRVPLVADSTL